MMNPRLFDEFAWPYLQRMYDVAKLNGKLVMHYDGHPGREYRGDVRRSLGIGLARSSLTSGRYRFRMRHIVAAKILACASAGTPHASSMR
jgi:hypothetical protein